MQNQQKIKEIVYNLKSYQRILEREYQHALDEVPTKPLENYQPVWKESHDV